MESYEDYMFTIPNYDWEDIIYSKESFWQVIDENAKQPWDWRQLSYHQDIDWKVFEKYIDHAWDWKHLAHRKNIPMYLIEKYHNKDWQLGFNVRELGNIDDTMTLGDAVERYPNLSWDWDYLTKSSDFPCSYIYAHPDYGWKFYLVHTKPDFVITDVEKMPEKQWEWSALPEISIWSMIKSYPNRAWDWEYVLLNPPYDWDVLLNHSPPDIVQWYINGYIRRRKIHRFKNMIHSSNYVDKKCIDINLTNMVPMDVLRRYMKKKDWDFGLLSCRSDIDFSLIRIYNDKPWDFNAISIRENFDLSLVFAFPEKSWDFASLSKLHHLDFRLVAAFPDKPWDWMCLSSHKHLNWFLVSAYPDKEWDYVRLSKRSPVNWRFVTQQHIKHKWDWSFFHPTNDVVIKHFNLPWCGKKWRKLQRIVAARIIKRYWMKAYYDPEYKICQRRLTREFENMQNDLQN